MIASDQDRLRSRWQWQPSLTAHDPSPPITLENPTGGGTIYNETGAGVLTLIASGVEFVERVDTGAGILVLVSSGSVILEAVDGGAGSMPLVANGADLRELVDAGLARLVSVASGTDTLEFSELGTGRSIFSASGAEIFEMVESGLALLVPSASLVEILEAWDSAAGILDLTASGADGTVILPPTFPGTDRKLRRHKVLSPEQQQRRLQLQLYLQERNQRVLADSRRLSQENLDEIFRTQAIKSTKLRVEDELQPRTPEKKKLAQIIIDYRVREMDRKDHENKVAIQRNENLKKAQAALEVKREREAEIAEQRLKNLAKARRVKKRKMNG